MPMTEAVGGNDSGRLVAASRAAEELELKRGEFDLAVQLGAIGVRARQGHGRPGVPRAEIHRLRSEDGFPRTLRERVRTVGTAEGADLLGVTPVRFTRLARAGCVTPVAFSLNRYRAVVWLYLAQEVCGLAVRSPELLVGNSPPWMRARLDAGGDCRPRNWRSRRVERLLTLTADPWARAAVVAQTLDPVQLAEVVDDPYERAYFGRIRPEPVFGRRGSIAGREVMERLMLADEPDEILWRRISLIMELDNARELRPAPRPGDGGRPGPAAPTDQAAPAAPAEQAAPVAPSERGVTAGPPEQSVQVEPVVRSGTDGPAGPGGTGGLAGPVRAEGPPGLLARLRLRGARGTRQRGEAAGPDPARPTGRRPQRDRRPPFRRSYRSAGREEARDGS